MKMRNKGKVYPSPSSSSPSTMPSCTANRDALSVLKLLPAAILALISVLSIEDREVLAYMITSAMKSENPSSIVEEKKKNNKKSGAHKPPLFDCECFDCYTSFWFKWDSSPNRELIHEAIEAFEEHLYSEEQSKKSNGRGKKREKMTRRGGAEKQERGAVFPEVEDSFVVVMPENEAPPAVMVPEKDEGTAVKGGEEVEEKAAAVVMSSSANNHKGLARKVLPDVVGLLNSRLWSLWSPNV